MAAPVDDARASLVAHVVVVGFHAALGNRIEFAYPRLRGDTLLRSPNLADTSDISDPVPGSPATPRPAARAAAAAAPDPDRAALRLATGGGIAGAWTPPPRTSPPPPLPQPGEHAVTPDRVGAGEAAAAVGDWGALPAAWAHLPFMAIPDGAHELAEDVVYFALPPDVHCVSCFRQVDAIDAVNHSASRSTRAVEARTAARGSVQKSVVLLCRRPLFGFLAARLRPAVRRYFEQADFARTDALAALFHELNVSLADPRMRMRSTLWEGVSLRELLLTIGPQTLAVVKLLLLEKRVVFYSQPVARASEAVVALASLLPGALDSIAPAMPPLDTSAADAEFGLPLALFGTRDRVSFQPYAPLPVVSDLLRERGTNAGGVIGTSHNVGILLARAAANAGRKAAAASAALAASNISSSAVAVVARLPLRPNSFSSPALGASVRGRVSSAAGQSKGAGVAVWNVENSKASSSDRMSTSCDVQTLENAPPPALSGAAVTPAAPSSANRLPVVDALVNMTTGKVSVSSAIEPMCRITRQERRLMKDLMVAASAPLPTSSGRPSPGNDDQPGEQTTDDYIRARVREYLRCLLASVAAVPGVLSGPRGGETWSSEMASHLDTAGLVEYNPLFVHAWLQTRNAAFWARRCQPQVASLCAVPFPELDDSLMDEALLPVERVAAGLQGLRENVVFASSRAAEGLSNLFSHLELQVARMSSPAKPAAHAASTTRNLSASQATRPMGMNVSHSEPALGDRGPGNVMGAEQR